MAADEKKPAPEPQKKEATAPVKKKLPIKVIGLIAVIMAAEAGGVYVLVGMTGPKKVAAETEIQGAEHAAGQQTVEIDLIDDKFQNMQTGRVWLWDMKIVLKAAKKNEAYITEQLEKRSSEIQEGIAQIVRRAQHGHLKEPELVTLSRQLTAYADKVFGHDAQGNSRVDRIMIPKCRGVDVERYTGKDCAGLNKSTDSLERCPMLGPRCRARSSSRPNRWSARMAEPGPESTNATPSGTTPSGSQASSMAEAALAAAQSAVTSLNQGGEPPTQRYEPQPLQKSASEAAPKGIDLLSDVNLNVKIELGRTRMLVEDVLRLNEGAVVELDKLAGDPVDVYVNDRHIARGEVLVLNDNFCVRINEIISQGTDTEQPGKSPG